MIQQPHATPGRGLERCVGGEGDRGEGGERKGRRTGLPKNHAKPTEKDERESRRRKIEKDSPP